MEEALEGQLHLRHRIERALDNFKKIGRKNLTPAIIRTRLTMLQDDWKRFDSGHLLLMRLTPPAARGGIDYFKKCCFDATEDFYLSTHDLMTVQLEELEPTVSAETSGNHHQSRSAASAFSIAHLPPIPLPTFDGDARGWEPFRDKFRTLILENAELNDFAKMHFLSSCLTGSALECIKSQPITADQFEIAWSTLVKRFENKRRLLQQHFSSLMNIQALNRESASELRALHDRVNIAIASLEGLGRSPSELWSDVLVHIVVPKLDAATRKAWNLRISETNELPSFDQLQRFLATRTQALEEFASEPTKTALPRRVHVATATSSPKPVCEICKAAHYFSACPTFARGSPATRRELVKRYRRCFNCLGRNHGVNECPSKNSCRTCQKRHHSSLHLPSDSGARAPASGPSPALLSSSPSLANSAGVEALHASLDSPQTNPALLSTTRVTVSEPSGRSATVRALLDSGSQITFITERLAQALRVKRQRLPVAISALGGAEAVRAGAPLFAAKVSVAPFGCLAPAHAVSAVIMRHLTDYAPRCVAGLNRYPHLARIPWADPDPTSAEPIELIIGADIYNAVLLDGRRQGAAHEPTAQKTVFGWVISGPHSLTPSRVTRNSSDSVAAPSALNVAVHHAAVSLSLDDELRRFWEVEELPHRAFLSPDEQQCEQHFLKSHSRTEDGRYIVRLPFRRGPPIEIGASRARAERQLDALLRRLRACPDQLREYSEFLNEYERLGHMRRVKPSADSRNVVFIPHHPVIRSSSVTTKLRVVFNASSVTSNGTSLNDHLLPGAKLQADLPTVLTQWRKFQYVYLADIAKMYRQILIDDRDADFQRILWRPEGNDDTVEFQLRTVTYGTASAPFQALRVLQQLVADEGSCFPLAVPILRQQIYVDDVLFGHDQPELLIRARDELVAILNRGGFSLRKWASNDSQLLQDLDEADHGLACTKVLSPDERLQVLGIGWAPSHDTFLVSVSLCVQPVTKRGILSVIARLFDPLGWLTPATAASKIFMQRLWRDRLAWDEPVSDSLRSRWSALYDGFSALNGLRIPRWLGLGATTISAELHGFADASNAAYAAVVYLRLVSSSGAVSVSLVAGKSRVAPVKPLSVPRLELCGAVLLSRLVEFVRRSLEWDTDSVVCWLDSTVALTWVTQPPSRWTTFVANRVAQVQSTLSDAQWRHIPTQDNPADCASRGLLGSELRTHTLWWEGPSWLRLSADCWPASQRTSEENPPEERRVAAQVSLVPAPRSWDLGARYSSWSKLLRVTAYISRFLRRCRARKAASKHVGTALSVDECREAQLFWLRQIQAELFAAELRDIASNGCVAPKSNLQSLNPFVDCDRLLRVGGRLRCAPSLIRSDTQLY